MDGLHQQYALVVTSVSKDFGGVQAVRSVNLAVPFGERRALIGPNGAGKTTLFNLITGELKPDTGHIQVFGLDVTHKTVQQRARLGLGRTYQISQLFPNLTVEQNLFLSAASSHRVEFDLFGQWRSRSADRAWAHQVAEQIGLSPSLNTPVAELSHGLQRQLEIGMAMAMRPRLIMLDEPAAGLTPSERENLTSLINSLSREVTVILIEHNMELVLELADRISVLSRGGMLTEGTPAEIQSNSEVQEVYLGRAYAAVE